jgi:hypothetical protein
MRPEGEAICGVVMEAGSEFAEFEVDPGAVGFNPLSDSWGVRVHLLSP